MTDTCIYIEEIAEEPGRVLEIASKHSGGDWGTGQ